MSDTPTHNRLQDLLPDFTERTIGYILSGSLLLLLIIHYFSIPQGNLLSVSAHILVFAIVSVVVLRKPYWGIIIITASLPISELFMPLASQPVVLFSGSVVVLVAGVLLNWRMLIAARLTTIHFLALAFAAWVLVSNPLAATHTDGNFSLWHLLPLVILMIATSMLIDSRAKRSLLARSFVVTSIVSAFVALVQYDIGATSAESIRATGLTFGPGIASYFFLAAIVLLLFDEWERGTALLRSFWLLPVVVLSAGIVSTVTRTTLLALPFIFGLAYSTSAFHSFDRETLQRLRAAIWPMLLVVLIQQDIIRIIIGIPISIGHAGDSIGFRYLQWQNAWEMFLAYPIAGVGLGRFVEYVPFFGLDAHPQYGINYTAHSTYLSVLAETGIVGMLIFLAIIVLTVREAVTHTKHSRDTQSRRFMQSVLLILLLSLFMGITGDVQFNKLFWVMIGLLASTECQNTRFSPDADGRGSF